jgi:hypothetical protein
MHLKELTFFLITICTLFLFAYELPAQEDLSLREKRSKHFTLVFPAQFEKYAHIALQIAEEEYQRISDYTVHSIILPVTIYLNSPYYSENYIRIMYDAESSLALKNSFNEIEITADYALLRRNISALIFDYLLQESSSVSYDGKVFLHSALIPEFNTYLQTIKNYLTRGMSNEDLIQLKHYLAHNTFELPFLQTDNNQFLYSYLYHYLEASHGKIKFSRLISYMYSGYSFESSLKIIYNVNSSSLYKSLDSFLRAEYSIQKVTDTKDFSLSYTLNNSSKVQFSNDHYKVKHNNQTILTVHKSFFNRGFLTRHFSSNGNVIVYADNSKKVPEIVLLDHLKQDKERVVLPFRYISTPVVSKDRKRIYFVGSNDSQADIYSYNMEDKSIYRLTNDLFFEKDLSISNNKDILLYSTNYNVNNHFDSKFYSIRLIDIATGSISDISTAADSFHPLLSYDGFEVYFVVKDNGKFLLTGVELETTDIFSYSLNSSENVFPAYTTNGFVSTHFSRGNFTIARINQSQNSIFNLNDRNEEITYYADLDWTQVENSTSQIKPVDYNLSGDFRNFSDYRVGFSTHIEMNQTGSPHSAAVSAGHGYSKRNYNDFDAAFSYNYLDSSFILSTQIEKREFPENRENSTSEVLNKKYKSEEISLYAAETAGLLQLYNLIYVSAGLSYNNFQYESNSYYDHYVSALAAIQAGERLNNSLYSKGRYIKMSISNHYSGFLFDSYFSFYLKLPLRLFMNIEGNGASYISESDDDYYLPLGNRLRGYPYDYNYHKSVGSFTGELFYIPFDTLYIDRLKIGPTGFGLFFERAILTTTENESEVISDWGASLKSGMPSNYYLKLDWLFPLFYGYYNEHKILFYTGFHF